MISLSLTLWPVSIFFACSINIFWKILWIYLPFPKFFPRDAVSTIPLNFESASSVILTQLYLQNVINAATMISGLLVGAGVGLAVLFKTNKGIKENLKITGLLYGIGVLSGIIIQLIGLTF